MGADGCHLELTPSKFRRTPNANDRRLVETVCTSCEQLVAVANSPDALRAAEAAHLCSRDKRRSSEDFDELYSLRTKILRTIPETFGPVLRELKQLLQEVEDELRRNNFSQ